MVALALDGGIGQGREGREGHGALMRVANRSLKSDLKRLELGQGEAPPVPSTSEPAAKE